MTKKPTRTSTSYSMKVGWLLIYTAILMTLIALFKGIINASNIEGVLWAYFTTAGSFFLVNLTRVTTENITGKAKDTATIETTKKVEIPVSPPALPDPPVE